MSLLSALKLCVSSIVRSFAFLMFRCSPALALSSLTLIRRHFRSLLLSASKVVSSTYLELLIFLLPIFTHSYFLSESSPVFLMICSAYRLNREIKCTLDTFTNRKPFCLFLFCPDNSFLCSQRRLCVRKVEGWGMPVSFTATHSLSWLMQSKALL